MDQAVFRPDVKSSKQQNRNTIILLILITGPYTQDPIFQVGSVPGMPNQVILQDNFEGITSASRVSDLCTEVEIAEEDCGLRAGDYQDQKHQKQETIP